MANQRQSLFGAVLRHKLRLLVVPSATHVLHAFGERGGGTKGFSSLLRLIKFYTPHQPHCTL